MRATIILAKPITNIEADFDKNSIKAAGYNISRWIPCDERLPEKNDVYIVSYEDAVAWLEWFNGKWFFYPSNPAREETGTIYAWMPFPDPYKGGDTDDE